MSSSTSLIFLGVRHFIGLWSLNVFRITFVADFQGGILIFVLNHGKVESDKKHIEGQNSRKAVTQS